MKVMTPKEFKEYRLALGMSKSVLSRLLGLGTFSPTIRKLENEEVKPNALLLKAFELLIENMKLKRENEKLKYQQL